MSHVYSLMEELFMYTRIFDLDLLLKIQCRLCILCIAYVNCLGISRHIDKSE